MTEWFKPDAIHLALYGSGQQGGKFCAGCGNCCDGFPNVTGEEAKRMAAATGMEIEQFASPTAKTDWDTFYTTKRGPDGKHCILLTPERLCAAQAVKPRQCAEATCYTLRQELQGELRGGLLTTGEAVQLRTMVGGSVFTRMTSQLRRDAESTPLRAEDRRYGNTVADMMLLLSEGKGERRALTPYKEAILEHRLAEVLT